MLNWQIFWRNTRSKLRWSKLIFFDRLKHPHDEYVEFNYRNPKSFLLPHMGSIRYWAKFHRKTEDVFITEKLLGE